MIDLLHVACITKEEEKEEEEEEEEQIMTTSIRNKFKL